MAIQHRRGTKGKMPTLRQAQFGLTTDTEELFVGTGNKNIHILDEKDKTEITAQLAETAKKDEVRLKTQKISQTDVTEEFLQQMAGTTPINAVPPDYSLTEQKFAVPIITGTASTNLFNKETVKVNTLIDGTSGREVSENGWYASDFIPVKPQTNYYKSMWTGAFFYNENKQYLSMSTNGVYSITTPANARFMKVVFSPAVPTVTPDNGMVNEGTTAKPYESYGSKLSINQVQDRNKLLNGLTTLFPWRTVTMKNGNTINLGAKPVFQSYRTGKYIFFNIEGASPDYTVTDGNHLVVEYDESTNVTETTNFSKLKLVPVANALPDNHKILMTNLAGVVSSPITTIQQAISAFNGSKPAETKLPIEPMKVKDKLSDMAPSFYAKYLSQSSDVTVVLNGDSISTTNYYTNSRSDAKNRPPLMTEQAYVTFIEEQLRWDGQKYFRYDTGIFTETATGKTTKEYDLAWDWVGTTEDKLNTINNRPAHTRILEGTNASVAYQVPAGVKRCDFIYRTDYLNAANATVTVSGGNGILQAFNESTQAWVEANGFTYSAKEVDEILTGNLRKSVYQKRLKMKVVGTLNNTNVTITNNGAGRLTYWGIQTGIRDVMFDFILSARGGHSIARLERFEEWDTDYWKPQLILWESPIINEGLDIADSNYNPKAMSKNTTQFATSIVNKAKQFKAKSYQPELVSWVMFFGFENYAMNTNNEWVYGNAPDGTKVSVPNYVSKTVSLLRAENISVINLFNLFLDYGLKRSKDENKPMTTVLFKTGIEGTGIAVDGAHFNTNGSKVTMKMFDSFFIQ